MMCCSSDCKELAALDVFWPGQEKQMCERCYERALKIADAMGFALAARPIVLMQEEKEAN